MAGSEPNYIREFVRAFGTNWFAVMSGGPSVPFAIWALFVQNETARVGLWLTAAGCIVLSAFFVWRAERKEVVDLRMRVDIVAATREQTAAIREQTAETRAAREARHVPTLSWTEALIIEGAKALNHEQIRLEVGSNGKFATTKLRNSYAIEKTLHIRIINTDPRKPIRSCKIQIMSIDPYSGSHGPWLVAEDIDLAGGDIINVPIAQYGEAVDRVKFNCATLFFKFV